MKPSVLEKLARRYIELVIDEVDAMDIMEHFDLEQEDAEEVAEAVKKNVLTYYEFRS